MIDFPIDELLDEGACLSWLERHLHPQGLNCPHCWARERRFAEQNRSWPAWRCHDAILSSFGVSGNPGAVQSRLLLGLDVELPLEPPDLVGSLQARGQSPLPRFLGKHPEVRPLPSAGVARLHRSYGPLRRPPGPPPLRGVAGRDLASTAGLPRCDKGLGSHAVPTTPVTAAGAVVSCFPCAHRPSLFRPQVGVDDFISRRAQGSLALRPVSLPAHPRRTVVPEASADQVALILRSGSYQTELTIVWVELSSTGPCHLRGARRNLGTDSHYQPRDRLGALCRAKGGPK